MSVITIPEIHFLPPYIFTEFQEVIEGQRADLTGFFGRVPFWDEKERGQLFIDKKESGKPFVSLGSRSIGYSLSHTKNRYLLAVNQMGEIGVDIEKFDRRIHPGLRPRITNSSEFTEDTIGTLQLWTIKEAVLKLTGTGLRTNMNRVCVERVDEINFKVHHDNKDISIVSLNTDGFWISVAWTITT